MPKGIWTVTSILDSLWCAHGDSDMLIGQAAIPPECHEAINELKRLYGEPPKDLIVKYMGSK